MSTPVRWSRGLRANLPSVGVDGTWYYCKDTNEVFYSNGVSLTQFGGQVTSVAGKTGAVTLAQSDITGLVAGLAAKANTSSLAAVATSGAYSDLIGKPTLATVATSGAYSDLTGKPTLAAVATSGAYSDLTGKPSIPTSFTWDVEGNAAADLTINNAGFKSTFNQTAAVAWLWANTTAATGSVSQSSPTLNLGGKYWDGAASQTDSWSIQDVVANGTNGTSTLTFTHSGSSGIAAVSVPVLSATTVLATNIGTSASPVTDSWLASGHIHLKVTNSWNSFEGQSSADLGYNFYSSRVNANFNLNGIQTIGWLPQTFPTGNADTSLSRQVAGALALGNGPANDPTGTLSVSNIAGSSTMSQLATSSAPTVTALVGAGATTWGYKVVAKDSLGSSIGSSEATITNAASLTNSNANKVTINTTTGAATYDVYRTTAGTSPATTGKIGTVTMNSFLNNTFLVDAGVLTLSAAATASGGTTVYTGTLSNIPANSLVGCTFVITGFVTGANNGTFTCTANTTTTLTLNNAAGASETHAGTATQAGDGTTAPAINTTGILFAPILRVGLAGTTQLTRVTGGNGQFLGSETLRVQTNNGNNSWEFGVDFSNRAYAATANGSIGWTNGNNPTGGPATVGFTVPSFTGTTAAIDPTTVSVFQWLHAHDATGFLGFQGVKNGISIAALATPLAPTVAIGGGAGAATWGYKVVARDASGTTVASPEATVTTQAATLTNAAYNTITIKRVQGAVTYDVYRTTAATSPSTLGKFATIKDTGAQGNNAPTFVVTDFGTITITAVSVSGTTATYTATSFSPGNSAFANGVFVTIAGFANSGNNGTFQITSSNAAQIIVTNAGATPETHAATAVVAADGTTAPTIDTSGRVTAPNGFKTTGLRAFASNAAAITGGLSAGDFYRTGADPDVVCVVH